VCAVLWSTHVLPCIFWAVCWLKFHFGAVCSIHAWSPCRWDPCIFCHVTCIVVWIPLAITLLLSSCTQTCWLVLLNKSCQHLLHQILRLACWGCCFTVFLQWWGWLFEWWVHLGSLSNFHPLKLREMVQKIKFKQLNQTYVS
jgi:hypothetical protein